MGDDDHAIANFNMAIRLNPEESLYFYNRSLSFYNKKEYNKAWDDICRAEKLGYQVGVSKKKLRIVLR